MARLGNVLPREEEIEKEKQRKKLQGGLQKTWGVSQVEFNLIRFY